MGLKTNSGNLINRVKFVILYESLRILSGNGAKQRRAIVTSRKNCSPRLPFSVLANIPGIQESPTTRRAGGLDFSAMGGKIQRNGSALIGAGGTGCKAPGLKTPNHIQIYLRVALKVLQRWNMCAFYVPAYRNKNRIGKT
jgi:hypothetical protein